MKNQPESHNNNSIRDEKLTPAEEWAQRVHVRAIDCSSTPKDELTVKATVALDKEQQEVEARGERWFHPHILKYGKGPTADARRKEAEEYYGAQTTLSCEGERALRFLKWRARYIAELHCEPPAETAQHAWAKGLR